MSVHPYADFYPWIKIPQWAVIPPTFMYGWIKIHRLLNSAIHARLDIPPSLITVNPVKTFLQCSSIEVVQLKFLMQLDKMKITSFDVAQVWF